MFERLGVAKLYATDDGQFFVLQSRAQLHAGSKHTVYTLDNEETENVVNEPIGEVENEPISVRALTEKLELETDLTLLSNMLHNEIIGANRKTAIAAIEKRIAFLTDNRKEA